MKVDEDGPAANRAYTLPCKGDSSRVKASGQMQRWNLRRGTGWLLAGVMLAAAYQPRASAADLATGRVAKDVVQAMVSNEDIAGRVKDHYTYLSRERSERTGGHLWTEKVVETTAGKLRMLVAEDEQPLTPERAATERSRLQGIAADPAAFQRKEQNLRNDETHAKQMLTLLPKAFLFSEVREEGEFLRIDFRPDPAYQTQTLEERVLHGISGTMLVEPKEMRLHRIEGRLPGDVSIGFGLLATIKAGSSFGTTRSPIGGPEWKTTLLDTDIDGKAIFFKAIAKREHSEHGEFVRVPNDMTVAQAVELMLR